MIISPCYHHVKGNISAGRIREPILPDAFLDLLDIVRAVLPGVLLVRSKITRRQIDDFQLHFDLPFLTFKITYISGPTFHEC